MKRYLRLTVIIALFGVSIYLIVSGYIDYRWLAVSKGGSEHEIHLEKQGTFAVSASPPGRSFFRPGVRLWLWLSGKEIEEKWVPDGEGTMTVTGRDGRVLLTQDLSSYSVNTFTKGQCLTSFQEVDQTAGPFQVSFNIVRPFVSLSQTRQTLSVHHFVSGGEMVVHLIQFTLGGITLLAALCLVYRWWF